MGPKINAMDDARREAEERAIPESLDNQKRRNA